MGWKGEINRSATFFASKNWRSVWLKSPKWYVIACQILLPNFLVFPHSKHYVTQDLYLHIIYILEIFMTVFHILWLWQFFFSSVFPNFSQLKIFLTYEFNKDSLFLLIHFYNFRHRKESKLKWFNPMRIYAFHCLLILFSRYGKRVKDIQDAMTHALTTR